MIGDRHTAALLSPDGRIVWWCAPRFDDAPVFNSLLDPEGPAQGLAVDGASPTGFAYVPRTNVLETTWQGRDARVVVHDFAQEDGILRIATCEAGEAVIRVTRSGALVEAAPLPQGRPAAWRTTPEATVRVDGETAAKLRDGRIRDSQEWLDARPVQGPHADALERSLLALKLLTHGPTGGIVAAPTTSLPEHIGGIRNWDYRYVWIRDTAFVMNAFVALDRPRHAARLAQWILRRAAEAPRDQLAVMYRVDGQPVPNASLLPWPGYENSRPVRVGNNAIHQRQLDAYGHVLEALDLAREHYPVAAHPLWEHIPGLLETVARQWREPDHGIWELPTGPRQLVYSKVMAWVAFDRAIRCTTAAGIDAPLAEWRRTRDEIRADVLRHGVDEATGSLTESYGSPQLDAANLRAVLLGFLAPDDPIARATLRETKSRLMEGGLMRRYESDDGLPGHEGAFLPCSFWLVEALCVHGHVEEAQALFERLLRLAGPLGLYAEEYDPQARRHLGNYPQAFTHATLISAAARLHEATRGVLHRP